jgi:hypothetical protein
MGVAFSRRSFEHSKGPSLPGLCLGVRDLVEFLETSFRWRGLREAGAGRPSLLILLRFLKSVRFRKMAVGVLFVPAAVRIAAEVARRYGGLL